MEKMPFNNLEKKVIEWYVSHFPKTAVSAQLESASLKKREWTRHGYYIYFDIDHRPEPSFEKERSPLVKIPIPGPIIKSTSIDEDGGCLLWAENGFLTALEMYANGDSFAENVSDFSLVDP